MKNQYFGDINDYRKYGLLRCISKATNLTISVAWMLTPDDKSTDGQLLSYLNAPAKWRPSDPELFDQLSYVLGNERRRHVGLAQKYNFIPTTKYFDKVIPDDATQRKAWFKKLLAFTEQSDLVFLDPDNGLEVKTKPYGKAKSSKYLYWHELDALWNAGKSILFYQHFAREKRSTFIQRMLSTLQERTQGSMVCAFSTANVVFLLALQPHHQKYYQAIQQGVEQHWGSQIRLWELNVYSIEVPEIATERKQSETNKGLSDKLINKFRDKVNEYGFVYLYYSSKNGKNYWNPICSCMDWISVAIRSITNADPLSRDIDVRSMQLYSLISSIDLVSEAIMSLNSILNESAARISPFKGDCSIFRGQEGMDDDKYFKHIRSCFGAHPVNINLNGGKKRYFASWPHQPSMDNADLKVILYSNEVGQPDSSLLLKTSELMKYLQKRYNVLDELIERIEFQRRTFESELSKQPIQREQTPLAQLEILEHESARRMNNDYLNQHIRELKYLFSVSLADTEHIEFERSFKQELKPLISEIYDVLQNCQFDFQLSYDFLLELDCLYSRFSYEMPKLSSCLYSSQADPLIDYYFERLNKADKWGFNLRKLDEPTLNILKLHLLNKALKNDEFNK